MGKKSFDIRDRWVKTQSGGADETWTKGYYIPWHGTPMARIERYGETWYAAIKGGAGDSVRIRCGAHKTRAAAIEAIETAVAREAAVVEEEIRASGRSRGRRRIKASYR